jgi:NAD(P)-dependent dehydrogenase (short-subunit alcohol dehydrogenase family)
MPERVLVTGACGLVGSATVARLCKDGIPVVATDLDTAANRRAAKRFGDAITQWCDLTQRSHVQRLLAAVRPAAIIHLAAVIPPFCYIQPATAQSQRRGNRTSGPGSISVDCATAVRASVKRERVRTAQSTHRERGADL